MDKKIILFLLILVGICTMSHVSAIDDNGTVFSGNDDQMLNIDDSHSLSVGENCKDELGTVNEEDISETSGDYQIVPQKVSADYQEGNFTFKIVDKSNNEFVANKEVNMSITKDGNTVWFPNITSSGQYTLKSKIALTTDANGIATLSNFGFYPGIATKPYAPAGTYEVTITGDGIQDNNKFNITINKIDVDIVLEPFEEYYGTDKVVKLRVINSKTRKPVSGVYISLMISHVTFSNPNLCTGENGYITITVNRLNPAVYTLSFTTNDTSLNDFSSFGVFTIKDLQYHSFSELQSLINDAGAEGEIYLNHDYAYNPKVDGYSLKEGIEFPLEEDFDEDFYDVYNSIEIHGNGHTIYGNGSHIFKITGDDSIYLYDLKFVNNNECFEHGTICNGGSLKLYNCTFYNNTAICGGAIYNKGYLSLNDCLFEFNAAFEDGGAIYNEGNLKINNCTFINNDAEGDGGAIATYDYASISNSNFSGNQADSFGGAVYNHLINEESFSFCEVISSNFSSNRAEYGGAIFNAIACSCLFSDDNYAIKYVAHVPQFIKNNMRGGVRINCTEKNVGACEGTIESTGFSFKVNKVTLVSDSELSLEILVTSNPSGEPVSGMGVKLLMCYDYDWFEDFHEDFWHIDETIVTDENGIACINLTYDPYEDYDNDDDEDDEDYDDLLSVEKTSFENRLGWVDIQNDYNDYMKIYLINSRYNDTVLYGKLSDYIDVDSSINFTNEIIFNYGGVGLTNFSKVGAIDITASVVNHTEAVVTVTNNTISVAGLDVGSYLLLVSTIPQRFYNSINATLKIDVCKVSKISFSAGMVFEYGGSGVIHMIVEGGTVSRNNIEVVGHPEAKITLANNDITVSNLPVGTYVLRVISTPEEGSAPATGTASINVRKATAVIQASKITVAYKKGYKWSIRLINSRTGKPISNMQLTLKVFTGNKYKTVTVKTDSNGVATYQTRSLSKGTHKIIVSAAHDGYNFNTLTSSIKVIKPKELIFKVKKKTSKDGASLSITVKDKKTKKPINGVKIKLLIYTGKKYKTVILKTKTQGKFKGVAGYATNKLSVGNHKVKIVPKSIEYSGTKTSSMKIKKSAKKYVGWAEKISG